MVKGPNGGKRPADVIGNAVKVMRIATGEAATIAVEPDRTIAVSLAEDFERRATRGH